MKYYHLRPAPGRDGRRLVAADGTGAYDLTSASRDLSSFSALARAARIAGDPIDRIAERHLEAADPVAVGRLDDDARLPVVPEEVWAAGVTYEISEEAREAESSLPEIYLDVYDADRPELFFKATASRTVGPGEPIGVRGDSGWNVPEPELGVVLYDGEVVGYTVGNDVSSREIEGENPLYLPQAKVYDRCCAIGPCVVSAEEVADPHDLGMSMTISRGGEPVYRDRTTTAGLARDVDELVSYLQRHDAVARRTVLLTGTSLVPGEEFTLRADDEVSIEIEGIGTLANPVTVV